MALADKAVLEGNHPFGAVLVDAAGNVVAEGGNMFATDGGPGHAETNLARHAARTFSADYLASCILYTSVEPCCMCAGTIYWANIGTVVYGMTERRLREITQGQAENLTQDLPCEVVFAAGQRKVQVRGPFDEVSEEIAAAHEKFWGFRSSLPNAEDLDASAEDLIAGYLRRLGVTGRQEPGVEALTDLMTRHMLTVPFENLDVITGTARSLSTETALRKVVLESRGGFCYELNEAFRALLDRLGFAARRIEARVWQPRAQQFGAPFDHLALIVSLPEGDYLVDVGYGDSHRAPLRLPDGHASDVSGEYRLSPAGAGVLRLSSQVGPLYEMTLTEQPLQAFAAMCRHHQSSPESIFTTGLICTRATETGRITLSKNRLIIVDRGQRTESSVNDLPAALTQYFAIDHPKISSGLSSSDDI